MSKTKKQQQLQVQEDELIDEENSQEEVSSQIQDIDLLSDHGIVSNGLEGCFILLLSVLLTQSAL